MPKMFYRIVYVSFLVFVYVRLSLNAMQSKWSSCCLQPFLDSVSSGLNIVHSLPSPLNQYVDLTLHHRKFYVYWIFLKQMKKFGSVWIS